MTDHDDNQDTPSTPSIPPELEQITLGKVIDRIAYLTPTEKKTWGKSLMAHMGSLAEALGVVHQFDTAITPTPKTKPPRARKYPSDDMDRWCKGIKGSEFRRYCENAGRLTLLDHVKQMREHEEYRFPLPASDDEACTIVRRKFQKSPKHYGEFGGGMWGLLVLPKGKIEKPKIVA